MLGAIAAAFGFAWLIFIMGGFVVLGVMILAGYDFKGVDLIIAALVSVILTLAYFASSMERQAKILSRGLRAIADLDE